MTATECIAASLPSCARWFQPSDMRVAGFSATPFRLDCGRLDEGEGKIFDDVVFDYGIGQGIRDGWLSPLTSKATGTEINISGVGRRGGEFIAGELERAADDRRHRQRRLRRDRRARRRSAFMAGLLLRRRPRASRRPGAPCPRHFLPGGDRRDAAPRARGQHRRVQGRHGPVPGQRQRVDDRLRRAAGRSPGHVAADAVDRTLRANGRPRHPQGRRQGQLPDPGLRRQLPTARTGGPGRHQGRRQQRCGRRAGHGAHQDLPGLRRDQPARRRSLLLLRLRMAEAEAGGQACDVRRRGPDPDRRAGVAAGHATSASTAITSTAIPARRRRSGSTISAASRPTPNTFRSSAKATRAPAPSAGGTRWGDPRRSR